MADAETEEDPGTYAKRFVKVLREKSINKEEPIREWELVPSLKGSTGGKETSCICGKEIKDTYIIRNKHTNETLIIGCECVKRFDIERRLDCKECGKQMTGVFRRLRDGDMICRLCRGNAKRCKKKMAGYSVWVNRYSGARKIPVRFTFTDALQNSDLCDFLMNGTTKDKNVAKFREWVHSLEILGDIRVEEDFAEQPKPAAP